MGPLGTFLPRMVAREVVGKRWSRGTPSRTPGWVPTTGGRHSFDCYCRPGRSCGTSTRRPSVAHPTPPQSSTGEEYGGGIQIKDMSAPVALDSHALHVRCAHPEFLVASPEKSHTVLQKVDGARVSIRHRCRSRVYECHGPGVLRSGHTSGRDGSSAPESQDSGANGPGRRSREESEKDRTRAGMSEPPSRSLRRSRGTPFLWGSHHPGGPAGRGPAGN